MRKLLAVLALCSVLVTGAIMAPTIQQAVSVRLMSLRMPGLILSDSAASAFAQLIIDFITRWMIDGAFYGSTQTNIGVKEKAIVSKQETEQAEMNHQAAQDMTNVYAQAAESFTAQNEDRTCRIMRESKETQYSKLGAHMEAKALAVAEGNHFAEGRQETAVAREVLDRHNTKYCSQESITLGRCTTLSAMPDADIQASTLLEGEGSETFTPEQYEAARAFIRNATDPVPPEALPKGMENTAAGQRFLLESKSYAASMSLAQQALAKILAARAPGKS